MKQSIQIIATAVYLLLGNATFSQVDSVYFVKGDSLLSVYATTDVDSVIFYRPNGPSETSSVKYGEGVTDIDGNVYTSVTIGTQEWMSENLRTTKYSDGTAIPNLTWVNDTTGAWCHYSYDNDNQYDTIYGKLYNWYAVETGELCPTGWHVPTDSEWTVLTDYLTANGHDGKEGIALKATSGYFDYFGASGNGTDDYGWNGLPGGYYYYIPTGLPFHSMGGSVYWWSSSQSPTNDAWRFGLSYSEDGVSRRSNSKDFGFSVRCLRDVESTQTTSQVRLENGETPLDIYQSGVPIDSIVGKTYQGGIIAYLDTLDGTGLIAAPTDQSDNDVEWGCEGTLISGADGTEIGTGNQNTADILAGCSATNSAAYHCDTLTLGGYNDWFLPSKDELNKLYANIGQGNALGLGNIGGFAIDGYWSSTEFDSGNAWKQYFESGPQGYLNKGGSDRVRAVRAFSNDSIITDADGNVYQSVIIGNQEWMSENLRTTKYSDGTTIPNVTDDTEWGDLSTAAWCHYDNDSSQYEAMYGKLYNWYAVETGKLCPTGWHVPTDSEWTVLTDYLAANGYSGSEGTALKSTSGWNDWNDQSGNGTDDYGWLGLSGGVRGSNGNFDVIGSIGKWWSSSQYNAGYSWSRSLSYTNGNVNRYASIKESGFSVRCLRD